MKPSPWETAFVQASSLATRLPWWGGLLSAFATYSLLHPIASLAPPAPSGTWDIVPTALAQLFVLTAKIGQILLPLGFLASAAFSGYRSFKRGELCASVAKDTSGSILRSLSEQDFALLVSEALRRRGYENHTSRSPGSTLEVTRGDRRYLVDSSEWRSGMAGIAAVRALGDHMHANGIANGIAVTSGRFTPEARQFAADKEIELIDGRRLKELIRAEPSSTPGSQWFSVARQLGTRLAWIAARVANWLATCFTAGKDQLLARARPPRPPQIQKRDPVFRPLAAPESAPTRAANTEEHRLGDGWDETEDMESAAAHRLTTMIRAEHRIGGGIGLAAPPVQEYAKDHSPSRTWPRMRPHRIIDTIGVVVSLAILWGIWETFLLLPEHPPTTPWSRLGTGSDPKQLIWSLGRSEETRSSAGRPADDRPLGQFRFGPPPGYLAEQAIAGVGAGSQPGNRGANGPVIRTREEPVEVYHSLRELETAFETKYVPPPECYGGYGTNSTLVKCGNHRIRARRAFIQSGGKVTPMILGSWQELQTARIPTHDRPGYRTGPRDTRTWDRDSQPAYRPDPARPWSEEYGTEQAPVTGYRQHEPPGRPDQDWRRDWSRQPAGDPAREWRQEWLSGGQDPQRNWRDEWDRQQAGEDRRLEWSVPDTQDDWDYDWQSQPLPVERRHWVDDL